MVTATILAIDQDEQGSIRVKTNYVIDGVELKSKYPMLNGKYYWVTRYSSDNFAGMTKAQTLKKIKSQIRDFSKRLICTKFLQATNAEFVSNNQDFVNETDEIDSASLYVDENLDGKADAEWTVKTDGTKTSKPYTPAEIVVNE